MSRYDEPPSIRRHSSLHPAHSLPRSPASAQGRPPPVAAETTATAIPGVIAAGTKIEVIKSGFSGTEGPIGLPDGSLIFTETQANRITRIDANNQTSTFLENTNGSNGLAFDSKGRLISVQTTPGKTLIGVIYPKGQEATLSDNYDGKPFGRPNDLVVDKKGGVYFSEPGPNATPGQPPPAPPLSPAVYYVPPGGKSIRIAEGIERPNGIQLSPDEKTLYVNNTNGEYVLAFDVKPDGTVGNRRNFAKYPTRARRLPAGGFNSGADGLAIDNAAASTSSRPAACTCSARRAICSARFRCRSRARTSRSPDPTRKRSTSSAAAPRSRCGCWRKATKEGRSNADVRIQLQELRQGIRSAGR